MGPRVVPYSALGLMALDPMAQIGERVPQTPPGLLVLIGSFVLFGLGTAAAITREKWRRTAQPQ
jgi:hypothetical protein